MKYGGRGAECRCSLGDLDSEPEELDVSRHCPAIQIGWLTAAAAVGGGGGGATHSHTVTCGVVVE